MSNIQYIKNITVRKYFDRTNGEIGKLSTQIDTMPDFTPDEVIVRAINHIDGNMSDSRIYSIHANFTNSILGSFCGTGNVIPQSICPNIVIKLNAPLPNLLEFTIYTSEIDEGKEGITIVDDFRGDLVFHLDFIKYKKT